jgi:hypothetical protein
MKTLTTAFALIAFLLMGTMPAPGQTVSFTAGSATATPGEQVTIPVAVNGFTDVTSVQFSMAWDPAVLSFSSTSAGELSVSGGNFGEPSGTGNPGVLTFSWNDVDGEPTTVADGLTIFSITFEVAGNDGTSTDITFPDSPTSAEVTVDLSPVTFEPTAGSVSVAASSGNTAPSVTSPGDQVHAEGASISVAVPATDAQDVDLTYSANGLPDGLTIDAASGDIEGTISTGAASNSPYATSVTVTDNGSLPLSTTVNFSWTVNAAPEPDISVNPGSVNFGNVDVGDSSTETILIESTGDANLDITSITLNGDDAFSITSSGTAGVLPAGNTQPVDITFAPENAAGLSATLTIESSAGTATVALNGAGESAGEPNTVTFTASSESAPAGGAVTVAVSATGFTDVTSTQFTLTWNPDVLSFNATGDYALPGWTTGVFGDPAETGNPGVLTVAWDDPDATGKSIANAATLFTITFDAVGAEGTSTDIVFGSSPTPAEVAVGLQTATFASNQGTVSLTAPPALSVDPTSIDFGSVDVGSSATETTTIESTGGTDLVISSTDVTGDGAFGITSGGGMTTLVPGTQQLIGITFSPESAGEKTATLNIASNAGTETISLVGTAPEPVDPTPGFSLSPTSLDFGGVTINGSATETITIESTGDAALSVSGISIGEGDVGAFGVAGNNCPSSLDPENTCTLEVAFAPSNAGPVSAVLTVESNAGVKEVPLSGTAEALLPAGEVTFTVGSSSAPAGGKLTVAVTTDSFSEVTGAQFTLIWDPSVLQFVSTGSYQGELGIGMGNFGTPEDATISDGTLTFVWDDPDASGKTVADGTTLFTITFVAAGAGGDATDISFADEPTASQVFVDLAEADFIGEDGLAQINALATISGMVTYYDGAPVEGATLSISGDTQTATSSADGSFAFEVEAGGNYQLAASKADDVPYANGINVNDLSLIRRHILNLAPLGSPYKIIAADVDQSENVSVNDISLARQLILGLEQSFAGGLWTCATAGQSFDGVPFPFQTEYVYTALSANITGQAFHCFRRADVDATWAASNANPNQAVTSSAKGRGAPLHLVASTTETSDDQELVMLVRAQDFTDIGGYQFTMTWNAEALEFEGVEQFGLDGLSRRNFGTDRADEGLLSTVWSAPDGMGHSLGQDATLFAVRFKANKGPETTASFDFSSEVTPMLAHRGDDALTPVEVAASGREVELTKLPGEFALRGNYPNPFKRTTTLAFDLPETATVSVDVYDILGRRVMHIGDKRLAAGTGRSMQLDASTLASGSYVYRVTATMTSVTQTATGQLVITR